MITVIRIELDTDNFLQKINQWYDDLKIENATGIELHVLYDEYEPKGYEIHVTGTVNSSLKIKGKCPKPCNKCKK